MTSLSKAFADLQRNANLKNPPTPLTYEMRMAVAGKGARAYDWDDKPHRLVFDLCTELERIYADYNLQGVADGTHVIVKSSDIKMWAECLDAMARGAGGWAWEDVHDEMLTAAKEPT